MSSTSFLEQYVDFEYLARVTQLNVAALAKLALAPPPPPARLLAKALGYTTIAWDTVPDAATYGVLWRKSDEAVWTHTETCVPSTPQAGSASFRFPFLQNSS